MESAKNRQSRRALLSALAGAGAVGLAGCSGDGDGGESEDTPTEAATADPTEQSATESGDEEMDAVRAAFVWNTEITDVGWTRAHEDGRQAAAEAYDWLETDYTAGVAVEDATQIFQQYAEEGYDVVFGATFEYMDPMYQVAEQYPDTYFEHCSGYRTRENMGRYYARLYEARFLNGVAAGHLTETDTLGYVAAFPIAEVVRQINAFVRGARVVNPDVSAEVRWIDSWYDPPAATEATQALVDAGADVINNSTSSPAAVSTAADNEAWAFAYNTSYSQHGGDYYASSALYNWEVYYRKALEEIRNGTWEPTSYWKGLDAGIVGVDEHGPQVPDEVVSDVEEKRAAIESGDRTVWQGTAFEGESDEFLFQDMLSFVDAVDAEVPSS
jgi:basic membrane protein A